VESYSPREGDPSLPLPCFPVIGSASPRPAPASSPPPRAAEGDGFCARAAQAGGGGGRRTTIGGGGARVEEGIKELAQGATLRGSCVQKGAGPRRGLGRLSAPGPAPALALRPAPSTSRPAPSAGSALAPADRGCTLDFGGREREKSPASGRRGAWGGGLRASGIPGPLRPGRRGGRVVHASAAARRRRRDGFRSEQSVRLHGGPAGAHHHREAGPPEPQGAPHGDKLPSGRRPAIPERPPPPPPPPPTGV
jgi:hypothetical protein